MSLKRPIQQRVGEREPASVQRGRQVSLKPTNKPRRTIYG